MDKVGRYNILEQIGKGGMGVVYRALDTVLHREVALKTHTVGPEPDVQSVERLLREARVVASFKHQNIVTVFDLGRDRDHVFIAMELLDGSDLTDVLLGRRHVSLEDKLTIVESVGKGLAHAHERGIVHRDIKPRNVFLTYEGEVKLLDFGLAHISQSTLTAAGQIIGTPFYMSPEQVVGEKASPGSDIFSLGSLAYELVTGERPFTGANIEEIFDAIVHREPTPIRVLDPTVPEELARIVARMMYKQKERRYENIDDLLKDLGRFRRFLMQCKSQLRHEARQALRELTGLARRNQHLVTEHGIAVPSEQLEAKLKAEEISYLSLVGLRDGANLQLRRLEKILDTSPEPDFLEDKTMTMHRLPTTRPPDARERRRRDDTAEDRFRAAQSHFSAGDLAGSLRLVSDALRLKPDHGPAEALAERVRESIVRLADSVLEESRETKHIDVLVAALLATGEPGGEQYILDSDSEHRRGEIAGLSDIFLSGLPEGKTESDPGD